MGQNMKGILWMMNMMMKKENFMMKVEINMKENSPKEKLRDEVLIQ